jgi:hypothetical protein
MDDRLRGVLAVVAVVVVFVVVASRRAGNAATDAASGGVQALSRSDLQDLRGLQQTGPDGFQAGTRAVMVREQQQDYEPGDGVTGL